MLTRKDTQVAKIAFLGLGVMGYPMAGHLQAVGHEVTVFNRTLVKAEPWVEQHGGSAAATPKEAARGAEFVIACVGNYNDLRVVCAGENGASLPLTTLVDQFYKDVQMLGGGRWDTSALLKRLRAMD
nr:NAD(P)-binding domain-containing protein [Ruegeria arenilitoris]